LGVGELPGPHRSAPAPIAARQGLFDPLAQTARNPVLPLTIALITGRASAAEAATLDERRHRTLARGAVSHVPHTPRPVQVPRRPADPSRRCGTDGGPRGSTWIASSPPRRRASEGSAAVLRRENAVPAKSPACPPRPGGQWPKRSANEPEHPAVRHPRRLPASGHPERPRQARRARHGPAPTRAPRHGKIFGPPPAHVRYRHLVKPRSRTILSSCRQPAGAGPPLFGRP